MKRCLDASGLRRRARQRGILNEIPTESQRSARIALRVNGETVDAAFAPYKTLLEVLREDLGLTGTKHGCELGECGACAVLLDGEPVLSCLVLALECDGREVVTVEGLATDARAAPAAGGVRRPRRRAVRLLHAGVPGDGEGAARPRTRTRRATRSARRSSGNLCRCTGYLQIFEAVEERRASATIARRPRRQRAERETAIEPHECSAIVIGKPRRRVDGRAKVTGQTRFADDLVLPRMLHCKLLRSPHPARAHRVASTRRARCARPGVHLVLTGKDCPIEFGILPVSQDEHALCRRQACASSAIRSRRSSRATSDRVRGARPDRRRVRAAARRSPIPRRRSTRPSRASTTTATRATSTSAWRFEFGDVDEALRRGRPRLRGHLLLRGQHAPADRAARRARGGRSRTASSRIWSSTQTPHYLHRALAKVLGDAAGAHPRDRDARTAAASAARAIRSTTRSSSPRRRSCSGRPVKICLTREEVFYCHRGRHPVLMRFRTGVKKDGTITGDAPARRCSTAAPTARYGVASTFYTGALQTVTYQDPALPLRGLPRVHEQAAVRPQARARHAAAALRPGGPARQDRRALGHRSGRAAPRDRRAAGHASPRTTCASARSASPSASGASSTRSGWREQVPQAARRAAASASPARRTSRARGCRSTGTACRTRACSSSSTAAAASRRSAARPRSARARTTCSSACVAEVLGIDPFDIRVVTGDTDLTPVDLGSYSSRVTLMMGNAAIQAAERARELLAQRGREEARGPAGAARSSPSGASSTPRTRRRGVTFAEAVVLAEAQLGTLGTVGSYTPPPLAGALQGRRRRAVADVLVHAPRSSRSRSIPATGWITCRSVWIAHDIGRALNPTLVRGQVEGSVYMGARRGADGGAGVPPPAAEALARARAQVPVDARVQEPDHARHARGRHRSRSRTPTRAARSAPRRSARGRCCRSCRRSRTRSTTRSACASTRCRSRRRRS